MFKGWSKGERVFAVCLVLAIAVLLVMMAAERIMEEGYPYYDEQGYKTTTYYERVSVYLSKRDILAQWIMAVGTLALFALTWRTLVHSQKTAADGSSAHVWSRIKLTAHNVERPMKNEEKGEG